jgi:uncharacterized membrane protein YecN with MAPEG domain
MIKALLLIFEPAATWDGITRARRGLPFVLVGYLLPFLALTSAVEAAGLVHWGKMQSGIARLRAFSPAQAAGYEVAQMLLTLVVVFISAKVIKSMGETFHTRHTFTQAFTIVSYGLGPLFLLRLLDAFTISPWVGWSIGIVLSIAILYHGVPRVMEPDPSHAFGLYLTTGLLLLMITGILRYATAAYLAGNLTRLHPFLPG